MSNSVQLPNRKLLELLIKTGLALILLAAVLTIVMFWQYFNSNVYYDTKSWTDVRWYQPLASLIIGLAMYIWSSGKYDYFYRQVLEGKIIHMDTSAGGDYSLQWRVTLQGLTRAGEENTYTWPINAKAWHGLDVGDDLKMI